MAREQKCPQCGGPLEAVRQSGKLSLNPDQWAARRAGDYYCPACPDNGRGVSKLCYWWEDELPEGRPGTCSHQNFFAAVTVNRLEDSGRFQADVRIGCVDCGTPFRFVGLPCGVDLNGAAVSVDGTEGRFAITPKGEVQTP